MTTIKVCVDKQRWEGHLLLILSPSTHEAYFLLEAISESDCGTVWLLSSSKTSFNVRCTYTSYVLTVCKMHCVDVLTLYSRSLQHIFFPYIDITCMSRCMFIIVYHGALYACNGLDRCGNLRVVRDGTSPVNAEVLQTSSCSSAMTSSVYDHSPPFGWPGTQWSLVHGHSKSFWCTLWCEKLLPSIYPAFHLAYDTPSCSCHSIAPPGLHTLPEGFVVVFLGCKFCERSGLETRPTRHFLHQQKNWPIGMMRGHESPFYFLQNTSEHRTWQNTHIYIYKFGW